jgi:CubicO group peptidase (beta-lactamase class C family)
VLARTGAPSASIAVVKDGRIAYVNAYGVANVDTRAPAAPGMRYSIGSISKQFTAAAILLLAEEGKLSLDDRVSRFVPDLTRAGEVTLRQLLSMTSGYQDYWPQDYVMPGMLQPVTARDILSAWAKKPLDFEPGTRWQYSNTNYVIAGLVVEKAAGMPLLDFLRRRVFTPLGMNSVTDTDQAPLGPDDPARYMRYALGPVRPAPKEGRGWLFAAGELAMTAEDLARWDLSLIERSVLKPDSYRQMATEVLLDSGAGTNYGLGVGVAVVDGRRRISHGGEVSGFTATNQVFPDERAAVVVLTNIDAASASEEIAGKVAEVLFAPAGSEAAQALEQARRIFEGLQKGQLDRSLFTANANAYFTEQALMDFAGSLGPLGAPQEFTVAAQGLRGGMTLRRYRIKFKDRTLRLTTFVMPDGKLEQYQVARAE